MKKITLILITAVAALTGQVNAQCLPQSIYGPSGWSEPSSPGVPFTGFLCQGHDTIFTREGWPYWDGDGYHFKLIAGSDVTITVFNCAAAPTELTVVDSTGGIGTGVPIPGAYAAAACPNTINFIAPYTGTYLIVFNTDGDCSTLAPDSAGQAAIKLNNPGSITNCVPFAAPANDTICGAVSLALNTPITANTAVAEAADPLDADVVAAGYACSAPNNTLWYTYTPAVSDSFAVITTSPLSGGLDAWVGVFEAISCTDVLTYIDCLLGSSPGGGSVSTTVNMNAGSVYFLMMDGFSGSFGEFTLEIQQLGVGIAENSFSKEIKLYPNPSTGIFNIINNSKLTNVDMTITNALGEAVYSTHFDRIVNEKVDVSSLAKGVYVVNISSAEGQAAKKLVIQ